MNVKGYTSSTYGDRIAGVYDEFYRPSNESEGVDVLEELAAGGRALELGVGPGKYALPLAARGVEVHGIEASQAMVDQLRAKESCAPMPMTVGDFADVEGEGAFSLVFVVSNTFFLTEEETSMYPGRLRYAWPSELDLMARLAGLRLRERWGDWRRSPFTSQSRSHVSVYERA